MIEREESTFTGKTLLMRQHEDESLESILRHDEYGLKHISLQDGDIVIVIGAHVGEFTLLLTTLGKRLKIYSYEPVLANYELLIENIKNNPSNCEIHAFNLALGEKEKQGEVNWWYHKNIARFTTLNAVFLNNRIERCKLMKFDCEGCEYNALRAVSKETLKKIHYIVGEWHWLSRWQLHELVLPFFADRTEEVGVTPLWQKNPPVGHFFFENYER